MDINLLTQKANQGDSEACYLLAMRYKVGQGVDASKEAYIKYIKMAQAKNYPNALLEMGLILGETKHFDEAIEKIKMAAKKGSLEANFYAGKIYFGKLYEGIPNYKIGFHYFEAYMGENESKCIEFLSEFEPELYVTNKDIELQMVNLYEKYNLPIGNYNAAKYYLKQTKPNYDKAIALLQKAHLKAHLDSTLLLFNLYDPKGDAYLDFKGKDLAKAKPYYQTLLNANYKEDNHNNGFKSSFLPEAAGYLKHALDYNQYVADYKHYIKHSIVYEQAFIDKIESLAIEPEVLFELTPLTSFTGNVDLVKKQKKTLVVKETLDVAYQNYESKLENKLFVQSERAIFSKFNMPGGIIRFNNYPSESIIMEDLKKELDEKTLKYKKQLGEAHVEYKFTYLLDPKVAFYYTYQDKLYRTVLDKKEMEQGILLEGPINEIYTKPIVKALNSMERTSQKAQNVLAFIVLVISLITLYLIYKTFGNLYTIVLGGILVLYLPLLYLLPGVLMKKLKTTDKTTLIKWIDETGLEKVTELTHKNEFKKQLPYYLSVAGILLLGALAIFILLGII